jgi:hypothetical protein
MAVANKLYTDQTLMAQAAAWLEDCLSKDWSVEVSPARGRNLSAPSEEGKISLRDPDGRVATVAVEERRSISPRGVIELLPQVRTARNMGADLPLLVVAPWISKRTQKLLAEQDINYIDLTGNALLRVDSPSVFVRTEGSARNPAPKDRGQVRLRGAKAGRLIRLLADVRPPYGVGELAKAAGLAPGYVSRLLDALYREALVERPPRGPVESVDVAGLLRRWTTSYEVFKSNPARAGFVAPSGLDEVLTALRKEGAPGKLAITGSVAAARLEPVTAPKLLLAYSDSPAEVATRLGLLEAEQGANVILLQPFDPVVWERGASKEGLRFAAPSQVAVDCLTGNGRMPAEGEALLKWMLANEREWRAESLQDATRP